MGTATIFNKLLVQDERDLFKLAELLDASLKDYLKTKGESISSDVRTSVESTTDNIFKEMKQFISVADDDDDLKTPGGTHLASPLLPPLSPPPMDAEALELERQVEETSKRVAQLRATMQTKIQEQLTEKLVATRPTAEITPPRATEANGETEASIPLSPAAEELRSRLAEAAAKMPELRAKMDDAQTRLDAVLTAAAAEASRGAPSTMERAVLGLGEAEETNEEAKIEGDET